MRARARNAPGMRLFIMINLRNVKYHSLLYYAFAGNSFLQITLDRMYAYYLLTPAVNFGPGGRFSGRIWAMIDKLMEARP